MALTWNRRSRRRKELKQAVLQEAYDEVVEKNDSKGIEIALLEEELEDQQSISEEARKKQSMAQAAIDRTLASGKVTFSAHESKKIETTANLEQAMSQEGALAVALEAKRRELVDPPLVPKMADISLEAKDVCEILLLVLLDIFKVKPWVAALYIGGFTLGWYLAEYLMERFEILEQMGF